MAKSFDSIKAAQNIAPAKNTKKRRKAFDEIKASDYDFGVDEAYINRFLTDASDYFSSASESQANVTYDNANSLYDDYLQRGSVLRSQGRAIKAFLNSRKSNIGDDSYNQMMKDVDGILSSQKEVSSYFQNQKSFYSQFESESDYDDWKYVSKYVGESEEAIETAIDRLKAARSGAARRGKETSSYDKEIGWLEANRDTKLRNAKGAQIGWLDDEADMGIQATEARRAYRKENETRIADIDRQIAEENKKWKEYDDSYRENGGYYYAPWNYALPSAEQSKKHEERREKKEEHKKKIKELQKVRDMLVAENTEYDRTQKNLDDNYALTSNENFNEFSEQRNLNPDSIIDDLSIYDQRKNGGFYEGKDGELYDVFGEKFDENYTEKYRTPNIPDKLGLFLSADDGDVIEAAGGNQSASSEAYFDVLREGLDNSWDKLTKDEINIYYYLLNTSGAEKANSFLDSLTALLNKRQKIEDDKKIANSNGWEKGLYNVLTFPANFFGGATAFIDDAFHHLTGQEINPYNAAHSAMNFTQAVRGETANDLNELTGNGEFLGMSLGDLYQTGMSAGDVLFARAVGGTNAYGILMGMNAASSEAKRLYESGASRGQIMVGAGLAGAAEMIFETLSIEKLIHLDDPETVGQIFRNALAQGGFEWSEETLTEISNKLTNAWVMRGQSDFEKLAQQYISKGKTKSEAYSLALVESAKDVWKAGVGGFISGSMLGGIESVHKYNQRKNGEISVTNLTENEKKVFDKVYNDRIAEAEEEGKKLSKQEKKKIEKAVLSDMENGDISIDTIESVLGGDEYTAYQALHDRESNLSAEVEKILDKPNPTIRDQEHLAEVRKELESVRDQLRDSGEGSKKGKLSSKVKELTQGDMRLQESYAQKSKRSVAFQADLNEYSEAQRATVKRAMESGVLNDTKKTHDFVDLISKIEAEKGIIFDWTNNAKLKETGFAIEGKSVNGYLTGNKVTLNADSAKSLNSVVGHEITHVLEGSELYAELQNAIFDYAKKKGDFEKRKADITELYRSVKDANIDAELTADLVGDYLFTDSDFVKHLFSEHRNVFQRIYSEIKYLLKLATAGSKEARALEKAKHVFDQTLRETDTTKNTDTKDGVDKENIKYSLTQFGFEELTKETRNNLKMQGVAIVDDWDSLLLKVDNALGGIIRQEQLSLGAISSETKSKIENDVGQKLFKDRQYSFIVDGDDIIHISKHFSSKEEIAEEIVRLYDIVSNYDRIELKTEGDQKKLIFEKSYSHAEVRTVEVVSNKRNSLNLVTSFYTKKNRSQSVPPVTSNENGNSRRGSTSIDSIAEQSGPVNTYSTQNSENDSKKSLSHESDIAPIGDWHVTGDDVRLHAPNEEDIAPVRGDIRSTKMSEDIAPVREDIAGRTEKQTFDAPTVEREQDIDYSDNDIHVHELTDEEIDRYYKTGEDGHVRNKKKHIKEAGGSAVLSTFKEIFQFVRSSVKGSNSEIKGYGVIPKALSDKIFEKTEGRINTENWFMELSSDDLFHAFKEHQKAKETGDLDMSLAEFEKLPLCIDGEAEIFSIERIKSQTRIKIGVRDSSNNNFIAVELVSNNNHAIRLKNAWKVNPAKYEVIKRRSLKTEYKWMSETPAPSISPEASIGNVPQEENSVKLASQYEEPGRKERSWTKTSTESESLKGEVSLQDLDLEAITYEPIPNQKTIARASEMRSRYGFDESVAYFNAQFKNKRTSLDDIALGEMLIQEAIASKKKKTAVELIQNVAILGTELGQKVQALSIIQRMTPEGQIKMLTKIIERGKTRGDKAFNGVELTQEMSDRILDVYDESGNFDPEELTSAVEDVKQQIADKMRVTRGEKANAWRYLSMLGNPKTHIRNMVSNVAMAGTTAVKNAVERTIQDIAPIENKTRTWRKASPDVTAFAKETALEMKDIISGDSKYSETADIKSKRALFKNKILNGVYELNSDLLSKEDWWFSRYAFQSSLKEYLTANGIRTKEDIKKNRSIVEKGKVFALEQAQIATFRQYSWLANKIRSIESKNALTGAVVGAVIPFKKTPINIAKTALSYSPLGFAKTLTYDIAQVKKGNMEASTLIDHLSQNITGTGLALAGYLLAQLGFLNGAGEDDKEGKYDYQLGEQAYSLNIGNQTFSLSWLSPVAMPLFVGVNAYEQLVEGKEWNGDVVIEALGQTLDPLSEMSFLSGLDDVLSSYESGMGKFFGIGEATLQSYLSQYVPTLSSQFATMFDDTKRSTKTAGNSDFRFFDETVNKLIYKIPFLRNTLEPSTDIWGNEVKQADNLLERGFETFLAPYARREDITSSVDDELKALYQNIGDDSVFPNIPHNYVTYEGKKYEMSAKEFTQFKKTYGQTAYSLMKDMFDMEAYKSATPKERAELVGKVYDYARDEAKREFLFGRGFLRYEGSNNTIAGAVENNTDFEEFDFAQKNPEKYQFLRENNISYEEYAGSKEAYDWAYQNPEKYEVSKVITDDIVVYRQYAKAISDIKPDKNSKGKTIAGSKKRKAIEYINGLDLDYGAKIILLKSEFPSEDSYNADIVEYLNERDDISYSQMEAILLKLGFTVLTDGTVRW